ncbi:flippase [Thermococcus argininiproducens]|uniref:Flippase n=1 Tax=Thermococcus argininiproducens TaxID=2866384 RepID=A0A9E7SDX5_9EURY|nr:flippase [Thermococcus argininiproducens]USH00448.1 flippase [Thermococcus argininiproducens]
MSLKKRLMVNASWLLAGQTLHKMISYLIILLISRTLGDVGLGQYSFVISFTGFVSYLSDFGINYYIMRELARDKSKKSLVSYALGFKLVLAVLDWFLIVFLAFNLNKDPVVKTSIILYGLGAVLNTIGLLFTSAIFAHEVTKYETYSLVTERTMTFLLGGAVLLITKSLFAFFVVLTVDLFLLNFLRIYFGSRYVSPKPQFDLGKWREILSKSHVFWFIYLFSFIYFNTDIIMLGLMKPDEVVGWYKAGYFFIQAAMLVPWVVVNTTMPSISRLWVEDKSTLRVLFKRAFQLLLAVGVAGALGIYVSAPFLIRVFFGKDFYNSIAVLRILAWVVPAMFLNSLYGSLLNGIGKEKTYTKIIGGTALLNVVLNYLLIGWMSYTGAALATVVTNWTAMVILSIDAVKSIC